MRWKVCAAALSIAATGLVAACASEPTAAGAPTTFTASSMAGSVPVQYEGTGKFRLLPAASPGARFSLYSRGTGDSADQGFAFQGLQAPAVGDHPISNLDDSPYRAQYWQIDGTTMRLFRAHAGVLRISTATRGRVAGSFQFTANLLYVCNLFPSLAGTRMECEPAQESQTLEVAGSFDAGPLGGESPGLVPFGW